ncbi:hypothetical protein HU715_013620 [Pseudomonas sp. SWRI12]|uniref:Uncharacterized protein n=1 Tax=Pseudomonas zanjanensis TaxID=2745496 RepID=A0A923FF77_9PSED|nr:hypothetical protein [Pseudomonas zanjanensis]MBV4496405.1 hypothetical protein [Pseudomonas zanjanensis]
MSRDWVVWLGCFLLFGCGAVWAEIPIKNGFFIVNDVHDFFEILGSLATVVAVCVAAVSINSWKHQVNAVADLELARSLVFCLQRYKDQIIGVWVIAEFAASQAKGAETPNIELSTLVDAGFEKELDKLSAIQSEIKDLLLRCQSAWKLDLSTESRNINRFSERCSLVVKNYMLLSRKTPVFPNMSVRLRTAVVNHWSWFENNNFHTYESATLHVSDLVSRLEARVDKKLSIA